MRVQVAGVLVWAAFVLWTLSRGTSSAYPPGDAAEFIAAARVAGFAHPPGYPLLVLLVRGVHRASALLSALSPVRVPAPSAALAANWVSACAGALASSMQLVLVWRMAEGRSAGAAGALCAAALTAFTTLQWAYASVCEVFALNNALVLALLVCHERMQRRPSARVAVLAAALCGLCAANQHAAVLVVLPVLATNVVAHARLLLRGRAAVLLACAGAALAAAVLPYAALGALVALEQGGGGGGADPVVTSWGRTDSLHALLRHFLRVEYGTLQLAQGYEARSVGDTLARGAALALRFARDTFWLGPPLVLVACGAWLMAVVARCVLRDAGASNGDGDDTAGASAAGAAAGPRSGIFAPLARTDAVMLAVLLLHLGVFNHLSNMPIDDPLLRGVQARFWLQPFVLLYALAGVGLAHALRACVPGQPQRAAASAALCVALLAALLAFNAPVATDPRAHASAEAYARLALSSLPARGVLFVQGDDAEFIMRNLVVRVRASVRHAAVACSPTDSPCAKLDRNDARAAADARPPVALPLPLNQALIGYEWYASQFAGRVALPARQYALFQAASDAEAHGAGFWLVDLLHANRNDGRRMFTINQPYAQDTSWDADFVLWPHGVAAEFQRRVDAVDNAYFDEAFDALMGAARFADEYGALEVDAEVHMWHVAVLRSAAALVSHNVELYDQLLASPAASGVHASLRRNKALTLLVLGRFHPAYRGLVRLGSDAADVEYHAHALADVARGAAREWLAHAPPATLASERAVQLLQVGQGTHAAAFFACDARGRRVHAGSENSGACVSGEV